MLDTNSLLTSHINQVEANMRVPTEGFIKHDMNSMVMAKRDFFSVYSKYTEASDKFISGQKKGGAPAPQDKM